MLKAENYSVVGASAWASGAVLAKWAMEARESGNMKEAVRVEKLLGRILNRLARIDYLGC